MNFKIKKEHLIKHLNYVIKGISNKNIRPILNCIKLSYRGFKIDKILIFLVSF